MKKKLLEREAVLKKQNKSTNIKNPDQGKVVDERDRKKNTSLRLDKKTLKALKIKAIENDTSIQNLIETLIRNYLKHN